MQSIEMRANGWVNKFQLLSLLAGALVSIIGIMVLIGWYFDISTLKSVLPSLITMKVNTAISFVMLGLSLTLYQLNIRSKSGITEFIAASLPCLVLLIAVLTILEYIMKIDLHIDQLLFKEPWGAVNTLFPGRMSVITIFNFLLCASALWILITQQKLIRLSKILALLLFMSAFISFLGFMYDVNDIYKKIGVTAISIYSTLGYFLLSFGIFFAKPEVGISNIFIQRGASGRLARLIFPVVIITPPALSALLHLGQGLGWYNTEYRMIFGNLIFISVFLVLGFIAVRSLSSADKKYHELMDLSLEGVYIEQEGKLVFVNEAGVKLLGAETKEPILGKPILDFVQESDKIVVLDAFKSLYDKKTAHQAKDVKLINLAGEIVETEVTLLPLIFEEAPATQIIVQDITERKKMEDARSFINSIIEYTDDAIIGKSLDGTILSWNHSAEVLYGYSAKEAIGKSISIIIPQEQRHELTMILQKIRRGEHVINFETKRIKKNGKMIDVSITISPIINHAGVIIGASAIARDITQQKRSEFLAYHDPLTGLPNRVLFENFITQAIALAQRSKKQVAMLFLDLDLFKNINDTFGHDNGDALLKEVAVRFKHLSRESDIIARLSGDEFVVALPDVTNISQVEVVADKLLKSFEKPIDINHQIMHITTSIGISLYPDHGEDFQSLLRKSDMAMYYAKRQGKNNYKFYTDTIENI